MSKASLTCGLLETCFAVFASAPCYTLAGTSSDWRNYGGIEMEFSSE